MWADDALTCTKIVLNGNLLGGGCPFSLPVSGVVINRSPFAGGFAAMPHGRVSMALTVMRALLAVLFSVGDAVGSWALLIAVCTTAALQLALLLRYLPYYDPQCNAMHGALATLYTWATVCTVIAKVCSLHSTRVVPYRSVLCWTQACVLLFHTRVPPAPCILMEGTQYMPIGWMDGLQHCESGGDMLWACGKGELKLRMQLL